MRAQRPKARQIARRGERIYRIRLKKLLEPKHIGEYVAIEVNSGDYFLGETAIEALSKAEERYPEGTFHLVKIGYPAAVSFKHPVRL